MRRTFFPAAMAAATVLAGLLPAFAAAQILELGDQTGTPLAAPSCPPGTKPTQCTIVLTRVTALATDTDGHGTPTKVKKAGRIVALTVGLSNLSSSTSTRKQDIDYLNSTYGGDAQVQLTVLKPVGKPRQHHYQAVAESGIFHVVQYLGSVAQLPILKTVYVKRGELIALTTPTWAPVLSIDLSAQKFKYRQSRSQHCSRPPSVQKAQSKGDVGTYGCVYPGTRPEYAATEVTYPAPSNSVH